ncbi:NAD(P)-dependent oxidoreductase [Solitalea canadensis]|nr:SDR family oxidoreductase [Solitalea canadensis]
MKLLIFGSTGTIGRQLVEQALDQGHTVTAFVRNPSKITVEHKNPRLIQGDVMDLSTVEKAMYGHDTVLCTLGAGNKGVIRSEGTKHIIDAMKKTGVQRLICQTTLGAGDSRSNLNFLWKHIMFGMLLRKAYEDHQLQEKYVRQSNLDWIIVRPGAFTDGARSGMYRHGFSVNDKSLKLKISRADVADFMLKQLIDNTYLHKTPGLSY